MSDPPLSEGFVSLLVNLENWLTGEHVPHALIGGVAVSLTVQPRYTNDVDAVIWVDRAQWESLVGAGAAHGFHPRISNLIEFAERSRVLLLTHTPTAINVDISFGALPFEKETIDRAQSFPLRGTLLRVSTPEDLVIMKAVAHRPKDALDIGSIVSVAPNLDRQRIRRWVKDFADILEAPELLADLNRILGPK
jgi:hypothetical protein